MIALKPDQYHRVLPLVETSEMKGCHAKWYSVIEGTQEGEILVDDPTRPGTAIICGHRVGAYYVFGDAESDAFPTFIPEFLSQHLSERFYALFATSDAWRRRLDALFPAGYARLAFTFQPPADWPPSGWRDRIPSGLILKRVDAADCRRIQAAMGGPWFTDLWGSIDRFLARGFGFCLLDGEELASSCLSAVVGGAEAEIQINTASRFHRRGLATLCAIAYAEHCRAHGMKPGWTTDIGNTPSMGLARKAGFVCLGEIYGYRLDPSFRPSAGRWGPPAQG
jgi:GNAT superfamily N-acetyltransferase